MKPIPLFLFFLTLHLFSLGQNCTSTTNQNRNFFTHCESGSSISILGNYSIQINNGSVLTINGNITITGTLELDFKGNDARVIIAPGSTVTADNLVMKSSNPEKRLVVDGTLDINNELDFGTINMEIDGSGIITADEITNADNITCGEDSDCPDIFANSCSPSGNFCDNTVTSLPVFYDYINAQLAGNKVELSWATYVEINFSYFLVTKSLDGKEFEIIGRVYSHGNPNGSQYKFFDESHLNDKAYYQIVAVDIDGSIQKNEILLVRNEVNFEKLGLYPNPNDGEMVNLTRSFETPLFYQIYTTSGVLIEESILPSASSSIFFNTKLQKGMYFVQLTQEQAKLAVMPLIIR